MSLEQLKAFFGQAQNDIALRQKLQNATSKESVLAIAQSAGFDITMGDFAEAEKNINMSSLSGKVIWIEGSTSPKNISNGQTYTNEDTIQVGDFWNSGIINNSGVFENNGTVNLGPWGTFPWLFSQFNNSGSFVNNDGQRFVINMFGEFNQYGDGFSEISGFNDGSGVNQNGLINKGKMSIGGRYFYVGRTSHGTVENISHMENATQFTVFNGNELMNRGSAEIRNYSDILLRDNSCLYNWGYITNRGKITFEGGSRIPGELLNTGTIDNRHGGILQLSKHTTVVGNGKIIPDANGLDLPGIVAPGTSAGGMLIDGDLRLSESSTKQIELAGDEDFNRDRFNTEHDFLDVTGDLIINGGSLEVSLINDFKLRQNQEFIIAKLDGELVGHYDGLEEGASVGQFESIYGFSIDLHISYMAGGGNDISLYTKPLTNPEMIFGYS